MDLMIGVRSLLAAMLLVLAGCTGGSSGAPPPTPATGPFAVGGSIAGLTASGLTLANGGDTLTVASNASAFVFPTKLATGTSYFVTIASQPAGLTCSIANGSGAITTLDVTSVQVTCAASTYSIGGSISGLTSTGLVLANGSDTVSPAANAASFSFATKHAAGSSYAASIASQPAGANCTIANGSGTIAAANVTTIHVSCSATTYSVGGSISGLTASGLTLTNGSDTLSPAANTTAFTFATKLATGAHYAVSVSSQPTGLTCTLTNATGTLAAADVSSVQVACSAIVGKHWRAALPIENNTGSAVLPLRAVDANGNVVVIWSQASGNYVTVWANRYTAATDSWGVAQRLSSATDTAVTGQLSLAGDTLGNAAAVWDQTAGQSGATGVTGVWSSRFNVGTLTWSAPQLIGGDSTPAAVVGLPQQPAFPQIAIDPSGNAFAVWEQINGQSSLTANVWAARYTAGGSWAAAQAITTDNNVSPGNTHIGFDLAGNAMVGYTINTIVNGGADTRFKATRYSVSNGTWGLNQFIAPDTTYSVQEPQLSVASNGDAIAIWIQNDGTNTNTVANHFDAGSATWGTAQMIDTPTPGGTVGSVDPQVALDAAGDAFAVWSRITDNQGVHIWANRYTAGASWGAAQTIDGSNVQSARYPQAAFDASGRALCVWVESMTLVQNGPNVPLIVANYYTGGAWGTPQALETVAGNSNNPQIILDASGNGTAVWDKQDVFPGVNVTIWGARFQ